MYFVSLFCMSNKKLKTSSVKKLPAEKPVHLDMTFEEAIKKAANTPLKKSKTNKGRA